MNGIGFPGDSDASRSADETRGVAVGIVVDNDDPQGLGRVRVRYPWRESGDESHWARIATPMAGDDMGTYFLPEVDDEVLLAFDGGDIDYPYVIGSLWNGEQRPPEDNASGQNNVRTIKSESGHQVRLDDSSGEAKVEIVSGDGHGITLDDTGGSETICIEDKSGQNSIEFDPNAGSLAISSGGTLSIEAPMIEINGDGNVTIEAGGVLTLEGALVKIN
jgi:uncharacterized protein involved in type VI secretion and phage assembly